MTKKTRRLLTPEEFKAMFRPGLIEELIEKSKTMGPHEADPSTLTPEEEARLDRWVEGYCASGHDPNYVGPDSD